MGNTCHEPVIGDDENHAVTERRCEEARDWLEWDETFRHEFEDFYERGMNGQTEWYEHERDMPRLSNAFPEGLFVLRGEGGRGRGPVEVLLLGGRVQEAPARVEHPPFDLDRFTDPDSATR